MAVTVASFLASYPEFVRAPDVVDVEATLAKAVLNVDAEVWGDKTDEGIELTLAHMLALSPFGQMAKLLSEKGQSTYGIQLQTLKEQVSCALRYL